MTLKTTTLRVTSEIDSIIDMLHSRLCCSRQEAIRRCILYCSSCPEQVNDYFFLMRKALLTPKECEK